MEPSCNMLASLARVCLNFVNVRAHNVSVATCSCTSLVTLFSDWIVFNIYGSGRNPVYLAPLRDVANMQTEDLASSLKTDLLKSAGTFRVLVGVTGSVAALKLPVLVSELLQLPGVDVRVVSTEHAKHFYNPADVAVKIYSDKDEWEFWTQRSDPVLHIELRRWADLLIIAPLDANTLGKIASGICDNLLTCVVRAWDTSRPLLFCPAMNTAMWLHPITAQQVSRLKEFGYVEVPCIAKKLVCGDEGKGAMAEVSTVVSVVKQFLQKSDESSQKT